jgi:hypothetical protein
MLGAADLREVNKLFGWGNEVVKKTVNKLMESENLFFVKHPTLNGEWVGLKIIF